MQNRTEPASQAKAEKSSLRLICIGDTHGFHRKLSLSPGDILLHSGDFDGRTVEQVDDFNAWLGSLPFRHKLVVAGNHDLLFDRKPKLARAHLTEATYLQDSGITIEGVKVLEIAGQLGGRGLGFCTGAMVKIRKHWDLIPDVLGAEVGRSHDQAGNLGPTRCDFPALPPTQLRQLQEREIVGRDAGVSGALPMADEDRSHLGPCSSPTFPE